MPRPAGNAADREDRRVHHRIVEMLALHGGMIAQEVEDEISALLKGKTKPDAIFAAGDRLTTVCFGILKRTKQKKDLGFIGFSNTQVGDLFAPSLTVIRQPAFDIGQSAIELLIQTIESKRPETEFQKKILPTEIIIRDSSKKVVAEKA